jgi:uncharacterized protein (TIGR02284 family)
MPLLRSDAEVALDEVTNLCLAAAGEYRTAGATTDDADLARLFGELAAQRQNAAVRLQGEIRRMGNLPDAPDADREAFEHLATRIRAVVADDAREALLEDCRRREEKLADAVAVALDQELPTATRELLGRLQKEGEWIRVRLRGAG